MRRGERIGAERGDGQFPAGERNSLAPIRAIGAIEIIAYRATSIVTEEQIAETWPGICYFHEGARWAKHVKGQLREVDRDEWRALYVREADGTYWRLDDWDKYQTRFLVRIDDPQTWKAFDSTQMEKELLTANRGGFSNENCRWADCQKLALNRSAYCVDHTYATGTRIARSGGGNANC